MPLRQQRHHHAFEQAILPNHYAFDLIKNLLHELGGLLV
jgi:hypothetical protein